MYFSLVSRVRRGLRDSTIKAKPDDFPRLLYRQETINQKDLFDGFLRNQLLVKVCCLHSMDMDTDLSRHRDTSTSFRVQVPQSKMAKMDHVVKASPLPTTFGT
jgi:hypothetical protein